MINFAMLRQRYEDFVRECRKVGGYSPNENINAYKSIEHCKVIPHHLILVFAGLLDDMAQAALTKLDDYWNPNAKYGLPDKARETLLAIRTAVCDACGPDGYYGGTICAKCNGSKIIIQSAFDRQEGGGHYKSYAIQPAEYVHKNRIPYLEGSVIYYVTRWRDKNGLADIDKAIHTLQLLKELEHGKAESTTRKD